MPPLVIPWQAKGAFSTAKLLNPALSLIKGAYRGFSKPLGPYLRRNDGQRARRPIHPRSAFGVVSI